MKYTVDGHQIRYCNTWKENKIHNEENNHSIKSDLVLSQMLGLAYKGLKIVIINVLYMFKIFLPL